MKTQAGSFTDKGDHYADRIIRHMDRNIQRKRTLKQAKVELDDLKILPTNEDLEDYFREH